MSQTIWSFRQWIKSNIFTIGLFLTSLFLGMILYVFAILAVVDKEMMQALIGAEATILGFFILIVIYGLTSFDTRIDRLEQQIFDMQTGKTRYHREFFEYLNKRLENIEKSKKDIVSFSLIGGIILFASLLSSILGLGLSRISSNQWAFFTCLISLLLLFLGIVSVLLIIRDLGKNHKPKLS